MAFRPRVFTIAPSSPFLPTLFKALAAGRLIDGFPATHDPLAFAAATIYLPTRRACRLARQEFLAALGGEAAVLPRLVAIGDIDEDELAFADASAGPLAAQGLDIPQAIEPLERRLLLANLILAWAGSAEVRTADGAPLVANTPAAAFALADALAHLIDDLTTRKVPWERFDELVPTHLEPYWALTLRFLQVARDRWPDVLAAHGAIEPAARRDRLIEAEAHRLAQTSAGPVIAAGSTASMPSTAALLAAIARLRNGAVVLPGLDMHLEDHAWRMVGAADADGEGAASVAHPQASMRDFLVQLGLSRADVGILGEASPHARERLVSDVLRPAETTEQWANSAAAGDPDALRGVSVIEAANPEEEALAIAAALREALEDRHASAALVTPDRALARRVIAALARWNILVDDSGGDALADTPAGKLARLAAAVALSGVPPVDLLALLKHPLLRLGSPDGAHADAVAALEMALLRGPRPKSGTGGLIEALQAFVAARGELHRSDPRRRLGSGRLDAAMNLLLRLQAALAPLESVGAASRSLADMAARHRETVTALIESGASGAADDASEDIDALMQVFGAIAVSNGGGALRVAAGDYPSLFKDMIAAQAIRRAERHGARVRIFGLLEFRLQHVDRVALGGLVEGIWPPQPRSDPWLSRPMMRQLGLDQPERRIGLTAHDFSQALGAREVILSRSAKVAGAPTVASRFVQRLQAVAGVRAWEEARRRGDNYLAYARSIDQPASVRPIAAPEPRPPLAARPRQLSVTRIEHWLRDPYTIYARDILRLTPLDPVDTPPGARDRGILIHGAVGDFTSKYRDAPPDDVAATLIGFGRERFVPLAEYPEARAFWWPRFERIAHWFAGWERVRRAGLAEIYAEIDGALDIAVGAQRFRLTARADRIERLVDGRYAVIDFKTGRPPSSSQVRNGLAPQLSLEGAILRHGRFGDIPLGPSLGALVYVGLRGVEPPGSEETVDLKDQSADGHVDDTLRKLTQLVMQFDDEAKPYQSLVRPMWKNKYGDYDHLARIKEWSLTGGELDPEL